MLPYVKDGLKAVLYCMYFKYYFTVTRFEIIKVLTAAFLVFAAQKVCILLNLIQESGRYWDNSVATR